MPNIQFTKYSLPKGYKSQVTIDRPEHICNMAKELEKKGYHFDIEILRTGEVSMTVESNDGELPGAMKVCSNDEQVPINVDVMILEAYEYTKNAQRGTTV